VTVQIASEEQKIVALLTPASSFKEDLEERRPMALKYKTLDFYRAKE